MLVYLNSQIGLLIYGYVLTYWYLGALVSRAWPLVPIVRTADLDGILNSKNIIFCSYFHFSTCNCKHTCTYYWTIYISFSINEKLHVYEKLIFKFLLFQMPLYWNHWNVHCRYLFSVSLHNFRWTALHFIVWLDTKCAFLCWIVPWISNIPRWDWRPERHPPVLPGMWLALPLGNTSISSGGVKAYD